jgi:hypothetical protein
MNGKNVLRGGELCPMGDFKCQYANLFIQINYVL